MSALAPKADIRQRGLDVRYVPKADIVRTSRRQKEKGTANAGLTEGGVS
jgi:hypothetical protein